MIKTYLKPFSTNNKRVNVARSDKTDIWPLAGELRKIIVAKSRWRTERTTHWRWRNAKIIYTTKTHWKITHHTGALFGEFKNNDHLEFRTMTKRRFSQLKTNWKLEKRTGERLKLEPDDDLVPGGAWKIGP